MKQVSTCPRCGAPVYMPDPLPDPVPAATMTCGCQQAMLTAMNRQPVAPPMPPRHPTQPIIG